jgi:hypothetical protein
MVFKVCLGRRTGAGAGAAAGGGGLSPPADDGRELVAPRVGRAAAGAVPLAWPRAARRHRGAPPMGRCVSGIRMHVYGRCQESLFAARGNPQIYQAISVRLSGMQLRDSIVDPLDRARTDATPARDLSSAQFANTDLVGAGMLVDT